jgi:hypothetical protein
MLWQIWGLTMNSLRNGLIKKKSNKKLNRWGNPNPDGGDNNDNEDKRDKTAEEILSGKTKREFPSEYFKHTLKELQKLLKNAKNNGHNKAKLKKAIKILKEQNRLNQKL